jgi:chitodextrinase
VSAGRPRAPGILGTALALALLVSDSGFAVAQAVQAVPGPSRLEAKAVSPSRIDLSWARASSTQIVEYRIYSDDGTRIVRVPVFQTSWSHTGLEPWTIHSYYVTAANFSGKESGPSNVATARTLDGSPPSSPGSLGGAASGDREITLTWSAASDPESEIREYIVYRDEAEAGRTSQMSFQDGSLQSDRRYSYKVSAVNGQGLEGAPAGPIQVSTLADKPPDPPRDLTATAFGPGAVDLDWRRAADDDDIEGYRVYRDGAPVAMTSDTDYRDTGLAPFTTYQYYVTSVGEDGDESDPSNVAIVTTLDDTPPTTPLDLVAVAVGSGRIDLTWSASEDAQSGVAGYRVYRDGTEIGTAAAAAYQDEGLSSATTYEYRVSAANGDGLESGLSDPSSATTLDGSEPSTPTGLSALAVATDGIDLSWSPSSDPESGIAFYRVFRDGAEVGTSAVTSFQDAGLAPSTTYEYGVSAVNGEGLESEPSEPIRATTLDEPGPPAPVDLAAMPLGPSQVELTWTVPGSDITGYNVYREGGLVGSVMATTFVDTGLSPETTYQYAVASLVDDKQGERSAEVEVTTLSVQDRVPPAAPSGLRLVAP